MNQNPLTFGDYEGLRRSVLWLMERSVMQTFPRCGRCGHGETHHRLDDGKNVPPTSPDAKFRCVFPAPDGPPHPLCDCHDFVPMADDPDDLWRSFE